MLLDEILPVVDFALFVLVDLALGADRGQFLVKFEPEIGDEELGVERGDVVGYEDVGFAAQVCEVDLDNG